MLADSTFLSGAVRILGDASHEMSDKGFAAYPKHGWDVSWQYKEPALWLPLLTVAKEASFVREAHGLTDELIEQERAIGSLYETIWKLLLTQRELLALVDDPGSLDDRHDFQLIFQRSRLFTDLAFVYWRRIADRVARAIHPLLFRGVLRSSRYRFGSLYLAARKGRIPRMNPLVDASRLEHVLLKNCDWFQRLRGYETGLRDAFEHTDVDVDVAIHSEKLDDGTQSHRLVAYGNSGFVGGELIGALREICLSFCDFATAMHQLVGYGDFYRTSDSILAPSTGKAVAEFWPPLVEEGAE